MTHCHREFFHSQWKELLDDDFMEAYEHGVVIECCDGIKRRFYLRIFSYSADYPEKSVTSHLLNELVSNKPMKGASLQYSQYGRLSLSPMSYSEKWHG